MKATFALKAYALSIINTFRLSFSVYGKLKILQIYIYSNLIIDKISEIQTCRKA
jgi:hypothetical protein